MSDGLRKICCGQRTISLQDSGSLHGMCGGFNPIQRYLKLHCITSEGFRSLWVVKEQALNRNARPAPRPTTPALPLLLLLLPLC